MFLLGLVFSLLSFGLLPSPALLTDVPPFHRSAAGHALAKTVTLAPIPLQNRNAIRGRVTDTTNRSLERVRVELQDEVEMTITQTYTDSMGRYAFNSLSLGTFIVKVHSNGTHVGRSTRISLTPARLSGTASHQELADFILPTIDEAKGSAAPGNASLVFAQDVPEKARKAYEKAASLLDQKKTEEGVEALKEALKLFMNYYLAWERLGIEYVKLEHYDAARFALDQAVKINQNSASSLYGLGYAQYQLRQWREATESLTRSLRLAPASANAGFAHYYLGLALLKENKPAEAEAHLKQAYKIGQNNIPTEVHLHLAQIYSNAKRYKEAADELELCLKRAPGAKDAENIRNLIKQLRSKEKAGAVPSK